MDLSVLLFPSRNTSHGDKVYVIAGRNVAKNTVQHVHTMHVVNIIQLSLDKSSSVLLNKTQLALCTSKILAGGNF